MLRKITIASVTIVVIGCANGVPTISNDKPDEVVKNTRKMFVGIPVLASIEGSYAVLDENWAVTVAHNAPIMQMTGRETYYHPHCDIALFRIDDGYKMPIGVVYDGGAVKHSGYPLALPFTMNEGVFTGDVVSVSLPNCVMSMSDSVIVKGMSGGGVYNADNELVGVNVGWVDNATKPDGTYLDKPAVWQSLYGVRGWIKQITGNDYYEN